MTVIEFDEDYGEPEKFETLSGEYAGWDGLNEIFIFTQPVNLATRVCHLQYKHTLFFIITDDMEVQRYKETYWPLNMMN